MNNKPENKQKLTPQERQARDQDITNDRLQNDLTTTEIGEKYHISKERALEILNNNPETQKTIKEGRPLKYKNLEELEAAITKYFQSCWLNAPLTDKNGHAILDDNEKPIFTKTQIQPYTVTDLAISVGLSRRQLIEYQNGREDFNNAITRAKEYCQAYAERSLFLLKNPSGAQFSLKNNWHWKDKQEIEQVGASTQVNIAFVGEHTRERLEAMQARIDELEGEVEKYKRIE